jgi:hypothetical protein
MELVARQAAVDLRQRAMRGPTKRPALLIEGLSGGAITAQGLTVAINQRPDPAQKAL